MERRLKLDEELRSFIPHVYFQPPESIKLKYPCVIYEQSNGKSTFADNWPYLFQKKYSVTVIDPDPDTPLVAAMATHFQTITMDRAYTADNLNHYAFTLYY